MKTKIVAWFYNLSQREQIIVVGGAVLGCILLLYCALWSPMSSHVKALRQQTLSLQSELSWINHVTGRLLAMKQSGLEVRTKVSNVMVQGEKSLAQANLAKYLDKVQQPQPDEVSISLHDVPFDKMIAWLQSLVKRYQISVLSFQSSAGKTFGTVNTQFTLRAE